VQADLDERGTTNDADRPLPPPWLDGEDFPRLNNWFYKVEPHPYFDARLALLMAP
jgi:hypothetical protein